LKNHNDLADRRSASANAKAALLSAYRAAKTAAEPSRLTRQAEAPRLPKRVKHAVLSVTASALRRKPGLKQKRRKHGRLPRRQRGSRPTRTGQQRTHASRGLSKTRQPAKPSVTDAMPLARPENP